MHWIDFALVRRQLSLLDVLALLRFEPMHNRGNKLRGPCLFSCSTSRRSFVAYMDTGRYYCFSCRRSGNALELWAALRHLTIHQAAKDLCHRLRIEALLLDRL